MLLRHLAWSGLNSSWTHKNEIHGQIMQHNTRSDVKVIPVTRTWKSHKKHDIGCATISSKCVYVFAHLYTWYQEHPSQKECLRKKVMYCTFSSIISALTEWGSLWYKCLMKIQNTDIYRLFTQSGLCSSLQSLKAYSNVWGCWQWIQQKGNKEKRWVMVTHQTPSVPAL